MIDALAAATDGYLRALERRDAELAANWLDIVHGLVAVMRWQRRPAMA